MRISDWSSDVCSSDRDVLLQQVLRWRRQQRLARQHAGPDRLRPPHHDPEHAGVRHAQHRVGLLQRRAEREHLFVVLRPDFLGRGPLRALVEREPQEHVDEIRGVDPALAATDVVQQAYDAGLYVVRMAERRLGKGWVSTGGYLLSWYH